MVATHQCWDVCLYLFECGTVNDSVFSYRGLLFVVPAKYWKPGCLTSLFQFFFHAASTGSETLLFLCGSLLPVRRWRTIVCRGKTCNPTARSWCGPASFQSFTTSKLPSCTRLPGNSYRSPKKEEGPVVSLRCPAGYPPVLSNMAGKSPR